MANNQEQRDLRTAYQLRILRDTVFHVRSDAEARRAAIERVYDQVLKERCETRLLDPTRAAA